MKDAAKSSKIPESECPRYLDMSYHGHKWPKSSSNIEDPAVPLERTVCGEDNLKNKFFWDWGWEKVPNWFIENKFYSLSIDMDDMKMAGRR